MLRLRDAFTSGWDDAGQVSWLASAGVELIRGHGRLAGERTVEVTVIEALDGLLGNEEPFVSDEMTAALQVDGIGVRLGGRAEKVRRDGTDGPVTVTLDGGEELIGDELLGRGTDGTAQLVIDRERRTVLGATLVGPGVGEQLHAATIAVVSEVTIDRLWHAVPSFPTMSALDRPTGSRRTSPVPR